MRMADAARPSPWSGFRTAGFSRLPKALNVLFIWRDRVRDRQMLGDLNDHYLRDIGLSRYDIMLERSKPFWRA